MEVSLGIILNTNLLLADDLCYQVLLVVAKTREALCKYSLFTIAKENQSTQSLNVYRRDNVLDLYSS